MNNMSILSQLNVYGGAWKLVNEVSFSDSELEVIEDNIVRASEHGASVCLFLKGGGTSYIPLSKDAPTPIGKRMNLRESKVLILERDGERIMRIRG